MRSPTAQCSLIYLICTAFFAHALRYAQSLARSLPSSAQRCLSRCVNFILFQPIVEKAFAPIASTSPREGVSLLSRRSSQERTQLDQRMHLSRERRVQWIYPKSARLDRDPFNALRLPFGISRQRVVRSSAATVKGMQRPRGRGREKKKKLVKKRDVR